MRKVTLLAIIAALSLQAAAAREIRREAIPETFWGTWAPGTDACKEGETSTIVLSARAYVGPAGSCVVRYVTEIPGRASPIYSARLQCPGSGGQPQKQAFANLIIRPEGSGQISAGPTFESLVAHHRCAASAPAAKQ